MPTAIPSDDFEARPTGGGGGGGLLKFQPLALPHGHSLVCPRRVEESYGIGWPPPGAECAAYIPVPATCVRAGCAGELRHQRGPDLLAQPHHGRERWVPATDGRPPARRVAVTPCSLPALRLAPLSTGAPSTVGSLLSCAENTTEIRAGTTVCVRNGPTPAGVVPVAEPGGCGGGESRARNCRRVPRGRWQVRMHAQACSSCAQPRTPRLPTDCGPPTNSTLLRPYAGCPLSAALPDWLHPWGNFTLRNASLAAACTPDVPPEAYANATLCGGGGNASALLAAALGGGLSGVCGAPCVYNPSPAGDDGAVTAWLYDVANSCWWVNALIDQLYPVCCATPSGWSACVQEGRGSLQQGRQVSGLAEALPCGRVAPLARPSPHRM